jgi:hypothetical protein
VRPWSASCTGERLLLESPEEFGRAVVAALREGRRDRDRPRRLAADVQPRLAPLPRRECRCSFSAHLYDVGRAMALAEVSVH